MAAKNPAFRPRVSRSNIFLAVFIRVSHDGQSKRGTTCKAYFSPPGFHAAIISSRFSFASRTTDKAKEGLLVACFSPPGFHAAIISSWFSYACRTMDKVKEGRLVACFSPPGFHAAIVSSRFSFASRTMDKVKEGRLVVYARIDYLYIDLHGVVLLGVLLLQGCINAKREGL